VGFENGKIRVLEMIGSFGHMTRVVLRDSRENTKIGFAKFVFKPPPGVDVVRERVPRRR
jgi:outer membrane lipoprotein carrier protein